MYTLNEALARDIAKIVRPIIEAAVQSSRPKEVVKDKLGKNWLTNAEAIVYLGLSRPTLARYRKSGRLAFSKIGANVYYRLSDIEALLEENVVSGKR